MREKTAGSIIPHGHSEFWGTRQSERSFIFKMQYLMTSLGKCIGSLRREVRIRKAFIKSISSALNIWKPKHWRERERGGDKTRKR